MLTARLSDCGAVHVQVPRRPRSLTNCNCSICRRYGVLLAYYKDADVRLTAEPGATDDYIWGSKSQTFIRCKKGGCIMQWKKLDVGKDSNTGVNARNFEPSELGAIKIRLLDGAKTWKYIGELATTSKSCRSLASPRLWRSCSNGRCCEFARIDGTLRSNPIAPASFNPTIVR